MSASRNLGGTFEVSQKEERLEEINRTLADPKTWNDLHATESMNKERAPLEKLLKEISQIEKEFEEAFFFLQVAQEEQDEEAFQAASHMVEPLTQSVETLEFQRMFSHPIDTADAYLEIQAGSGGTEAQDWAEMLLRMYLRWGEKKGFQMTLLEASSGEVAGLKGATVKVMGAYAYGWLRTETGVHRLVRKSPFDSGNRRHTSFAAVFVSPVVDETIDIVVQTSDLRIDTYRASGAGGQHVNRTDSAVRITHLPTGIVVQCQNNRSQHQNRSQAMEQLRGKLYEKELQKRRSEQLALEESKTDIEWGNQIRSYILDDSRVKDLRTGFENTHPQSVLDGNALEEFLIASLKSGYNDRKY